MKEIRYFIEYGLVRVVLFLFDILPYRLACMVGVGAGTLYWWIDRKRQKVAIGNILKSGIETDPKKARSIAKKAVHNMAILVVESLRSTDFLDGDKLFDHITLKIQPDAMAALEDPEKGLIIASGHFGNWEVAGHYLSRFKPVAGITRKMNNPRVEKLVKQRKSRYRFRPIPKHDSNTLRFLEVLDEKEILALLFDQHAGAYGLMVPFFGHPAATFKTAAMLHLVTRTPLCFASCKRVGPMQFEIKTSNLIQVKRSGKKEEDLRNILSQLSNDLENVIREDPTQYLWAHRRWRDGE